ncbi:MAG: PadR family transcriptional regulator [Mobilitalea sp.]
MVFRANAELLDAIVLSAVSSNMEGIYGYKLTQDIRQIIEISESSCYPVLRRLHNDNFLEEYTIVIEKRERRYYKITETGVKKLLWYRDEWRNYSINIENIFRKV